MGIEHLPFTTSGRKARQFVTIDRERLESLIANAIEMLDLIDGDADLEHYDADEEDDDPDHCITGDEGLHPMIVDGKIRWGSELDDYARAPDYGINQTQSRFAQPEYLASNDV